MFINWSTVSQPSCTIEGLCSPATPPPPVRSLATTPLLPCPSDFNDGTYGNTLKQSHGVDCFHSSNPQLKKLNSSSRYSEYASDPNLQRPDHFYCEVDWTSQSPVSEGLPDERRYTHHLQVPLLPSRASSEQLQSPDCSIYYDRNSDSSFATLPSVDYNINEDCGGQNEMYEKRFSKLCNTDASVVYRGTSRERINQLNKNRRGVLFRDLDSSAHEDDLTIPIRKCNSYFSFGQCVVPNRYLIQKLTLSNAFGRIYPLTFVIIYASWNIIFLTIQQIYDNNNDFMFAFTPVINTTFVLRCSTIP